MLRWRWDMQRSRSSVSGQHHTNHGARRAWRGWPCCRAAGDLGKGRRWCRQLSGGADGDMAAGGGRNAHFISCPWDWCQAAQPIVSKVSAFDNFKCLKPLTVFLFPGISLIFQDAIFQWVWKVPLLLFWRPSVTYQDLPNWILCLANAVCCLPLL